MLRFYAWGSSVCPTPSVEETVFVSVCALDTPVKDRWTVYICGFISVLSSVLFLSASVFIPIPYNFVGSGSVIYFEIQRCDPSSLVLLSQDRFWLFWVSCGCFRIDFIIYFPVFVRQCNFHGNSESLEISLGRTDIVTIFSFPNA